jgi:ADP-ribose pyrophosphatase YjhB (NUDIX family)
MGGRADRASFCRFTTVRAGYGSSIHRIPPGGFCLSVFLVLTASARSHRLLLGRPKANVAWDRLAGYRTGGIDSDRWILPASLLRFRESPDDAVERIRREQLPGIPIHLSSTTVVSESYSPRGRPEWRDHWDLRFIYRGQAPGAALRPGSPWKELRFLEVNEARGLGIGRSHGDVLAEAGFNPMSASRTV